MDRGRRPPPRSRRSRPSPRAPPSPSPRASRALARDVHARVPVYVPVDVPATPFAAPADSTTLPCRMRRHGRARLAASLGTLLVSLGAGAAVAHTVADDEPTPAATKPAAATPPAAVTPPAGPPGAAAAGAGA